MFNKNLWSRLLLILKNRDYSSLSMGFLYAAFRFLGLVLAVPAILILWILKPVLWVKVGGLQYGRIGHLALNTDLFLRQRQLGIYPNDPYYLFISNPNNLANRQLLKMWKRILPIYESRVLSWLFYGMLPVLKRTPFHLDLQCFSNEYYEFNNAKSSLYFTPDEIEKGRNLLNQMNVDLDKDAFVCIFARDNTYLKHNIPYHDWDYQNARNSDIDSLIETTKYLIEKGFTVIRIGSMVNKPISYSHAKLIDYSCSENQSDFLDIFLIAQCKFLLAAGSSGIINVADIFDKPTLIVNLAEYQHPPFGKNALYTPKKYKYKSTGNYLRFEDAIKLGEVYPNITDLGLETEETSSQDILETTKEMLARLENKFSYSHESTKLIQAFCKLWSESGVIGSSTKTPIGIAWLKKNQALYF